MAQAYVFFIGTFILTPLMYLVFWAAHKKFFGRISLAIELIVALPMLFFTFLSVVIMIALIKGGQGGPNH